MDIDYVADTQLAQTTTPTDDRRTKTLSALDDFIRTQRTLLERAQCDIQRLRRLQCRAATNPGEVLLRCIAPTRHEDNKNSIDGNEGFADMANIRTLGEFAAEVRESGGCVEGIDWKLFEGQDTQSLRALTSRSRRLNSTSVLPPIDTPPLGPPPLKQRDASSRSLSKQPTPGPPAVHNASCSTLSDLGRLVRERAKDIYPALASAATFIASLGPDSDTDSDADEKTTNGRRGSKKNGFGRHNRRRQGSTTGSIDLNCLSRPRGPGGLFRSTKVKDQVNGAGSMPPPPTVNRKRRRSSLDGLALEPALSAEIEALSNGHVRRSRKPSVGTPQATYPSPAPQQRTPNLVEGPSRSKNGGLSKPRGRPPKAQASASTSATATSPITPDPEPPRPRLVVKLRIPPRPQPPPLTNGNLTAVAGRQPQDHSAQSPSCPPSRLRQPSTSTAYSEDFPDIRQVKVEHEDGASEVELDSGSLSIRSQSEPQSLPDSLAEDGDARIRDHDLHDELEQETLDVPSLSQVPRGGPKPRPATFMKQWSDSEHRQLEQLMEEIPEGTKLRWRLISEAMGGQRTARQIASHVQKYYLKLKQYGLER